MLVELLFGDAAAATIALVVIVTAAAAVETLVHVLICVEVVVLANWSVVLGGNVFEGSFLRLIVNSITIVGFIVVVEAPLFKYRGLLSSQPLYVFHVLLFFFLQLGKYGLLAWQLADQSPVRVGKDPSLGLWCL